MKLLKKLYQYVVPLMLLFQMQLESSTYKGSQSSRPSAGDKGFFNALRAYSVQGELSTPIEVAKIHAFDGKLYLQGGKTVITHFAEMFDVRCTL